MLIKGYYKEDDMNAKEFEEWLIKNKANKYIIKCLKGMSLQEAINELQYINIDWFDWITSNLKKIPEGFIFPDLEDFDYDCDLNLNSLTEIPEGTVFQRIRGSLFLNSLRKLPKNFNFSRIGIDLYLDSLKELPEGVTFSYIGRDVYLNELEELPKGVEFKNIGGWIHLKSLAKKHESVILPQNSYAYKFRNQEEIVKSWDRYTVIF
jgi:hypothetical protein